MKYFLPVLLLVLISHSLHSQTFDIEIEDEDPQLQLKTPDDMRFFRLYGAGSEVTNPLLYFQRTDTLKISKGNADFSNYYEFMRFSPSGRIGVNMENPKGYLHIKGNSGFTIPLLGLTQDGLGAPTISMQNNTPGTEDIYWSMRGFSATDSTDSEYNISYYDEGSRDILSLGPDGEHRMEVFGNKNLFRIYTDAGFVGWNGVFPNAYVLGLSANIPTGFIDFRTNSQTRMIIDSEGRVGINKFGPDATLHVDGRIKIGDDDFSPSNGMIRYSNGVFQGLINSGWRDLNSSNPNDTLVYTINFEDFYPRESTDGYTVATTTGVYINSGPGTLSAGINLPDGADIWDAFVVLSDNSQSDLEVKIERVPMLGTTYETIYEYTSSGISGSATAFEKHQMSVDNLQGAINNENYAFVASATCASWESDIRLKAVIIRYRKLKDSNYD